MRKGVELPSIKESDKERAEFLNWLSGIDHVAQHHDFRSRRQEGTGRWLLELTQYQDWVSANSAKRTLYCPGMPGAGKTILASRVIDDLMTRFSNQSSEIGIAYIYFNFRRHDQQQYPAVMASLLQQLCHGLASIPDCIITMYKTHKEKGTRPTTDEIAEGLEKVVGAYTRQLFIIADAMDESSVHCRTAFQNEIFSLQDQTSIPISFFATSRFIPDITDTFRCRSSTESLEIRASRQDIEYFVDGHLDRLLPFVRRNVKLQNEIKDGITQAVDGM